jgi:DNA-binding FadR family transcriptional regulator
MKIPESLPNRRYNKISRQLIEAIQNGVYPVGKKLPPERELAEKMKVSRTTLREAFIALELMRYVDIRIGSGIYVLPEAAREFENSPKLQHDPGPADQLEIRRLIEGHLAYKAALNAEENDIQKLQELLALMNQHKRDAAEFEKFDKQFHLVIAKASGNVLGPNLVKWLWNMREAEMFFSWFSKTRSESYRQRTVRDHEKILKGISMCMPDVALTAMQHHIDVIRERFFERNI